MIRMKRGFLLGILAACLLFSGCDVIMNAAGDVAGSSGGNSNKTIRQKAYENAVSYLNNKDISYVDGAAGDGFLSTTFDNVGFVTLCYRDALRNTGYSLLYDKNITVDDLKSDTYSKSAPRPERGDLVFFNKEGHGSCVGIIESYGNEITYIGALKNTDVLGDNKIVDRRRIKKDDTVVCRVIKVKDRNGNIY